MQKRTSEIVNITISEIMEYLFCPRFIYFMNCLSIPQHEEQRYKVLIGRDIHKKKMNINKDYLRKKIGCEKKFLNVYMYSEKYRVRGIVDEVLYLKDGTYAPLDYKFAEYKQRIYKTLRFQSVFYSLLIQEIFKGEVKRGYIVYIRSKNYLKEVKITDKDFERIKEIISDIFKIIEDGYFPKKTPYNMKCIDCCYKNICL